MKLRVIETFSGIGAQAKALENIRNNDPTFDYEISATVEWEIGAMVAYDIIHHGKQDLSKYEDLSKDYLVKFLSKFNLSFDGKQPLKKETISRMNLTMLKTIYHSIKKNNNFVDITTVEAANLPDADLLTYSFPCQDLSISSYWHQNFSGISKESNNRSSLLWQIDRILSGYDKLNKAKPRFLLMENVTAIKSSLHRENFELWKQHLKDLGYKSYDLNLNAKNFGIPQNRVRTFMLSVFVDDIDKDTWGIVKRRLNECKINLSQTKEPPGIKSFLRLNYSDNEAYLQEAIESTPNFTPSRRTIYDTSSILAVGSETMNEIAKTITTKQDRKPNAGIIEHKLQLDDCKAPYRNLTPRETFLLMGFDESDFDRLLENNVNVTCSRKLLNHSKLLKLTGNSIVVNVLEGIFKEVNSINKIFFNNNEVTKEEDKVLQ